MPLPWWDITNRLAFDKVSNSPLTNGQNPTNPVCMLHTGSDGLVSQLLAEIESYCREVGMAETTFGRKALNDGKVVGRLRAGGRVWPETADKVRLFIEQNPPEARAS